MKRFMLLLLVMFLLVCGSAIAQDDYPKAEIFGGFSILNTNLGGELDRYTFYGFQANGTFNFSENLGMHADFGGQYKTLEGYNEDVSVSEYQYLFGPQFSMRQERTTIFAHALFGGVNLRALDMSENAFAMGFGGGLDVNISDRLAVRAVQFDWIPTNFSDEWQTDMIRFGFGIVIK